MENKVINYKKDSSTSLEYILSILVVTTALIIMVSLNYEAAKLISNVLGIAGFNVIFVVLNTMAVITVGTNGVVIYKIMPNIMIRPSYDEESSRMIATYENITDITINGNEELKGYLIPGEDHGTVLIYFGGIDETAACSAIRLFDQRKSGLLDISCDIAVVDWPEYGQSSGKGTSDTLKQAAVDIVRYFQVSHEKVIIMGYSMGTGYAVYAANVCNCDDLILISPYSDASDLCNSAINVFHGITSNLLSYKLPVSGYARDVEVSPMIFASRSDRRVRYYTSLRLAQNFKNGSMFVKLEGLSHGEMPTSENVLRMITDRIS